MKKLIYLLTAAALVLSLAACEATQEPISNNDIVNIWNEEIAGEITVSAYDDLFYGRFLDEAAKAFEAKYYGTKINIDMYSLMPEIKASETDEGFVAMSSESVTMQTKEDYISRINTYLMGGQGADIYAMDVLPFHKYAESGVLEDLRAFIEEDPEFIKTDYRMNIIEAMKYKGAQYLMPLDITFSFYTFNKSKLGEDARDTLGKNYKFTYDEMIETARDDFSSETNRMFEYQGKAHAFYMLFRDNYGEFVDIENKEINFVNDEFTTLLEKIQNHGEAGYFLQPVTSAEDSMREYMEFEEMYFYNIQTSQSLKNIYAPRDESLEELRRFRNPEIDEIAGLMANDKGDVIFRYSQAYVMNANSENKRLAWEFIKFLLSEDMQQSFNLFGHPINNSAFVEESKLNFTKIPNYREDPTAEWGYALDGYNEITDELHVEAYDQYFEYLNKFMNALNRHYNEDDIITEMVRCEAALFFEGVKSAEEVADTLQSRVQLYLDE